MGFLSKLFKSDKKKEKSKDSPGLNQRLDQQVNDIDRRSESNQAALEEISREPESVYVAPKKKSEGFFRRVWNYVKNVLSFSRENYLEGANKARNENDNFQDFLIQKVTFQKGYSSFVNDTDSALTLVPRAKTKETELQEVRKSEGDVAASDDIVVGVEEELSDNVTAGEDKSATAGAENEEATAAPDDANEALQDSVQAGEEDTVDISRESIKRSRTKQGDEIEQGAVDVLYKGVLKLISPKAVFKASIVGTNSAEYETKEAELLFMGKWRTITSQDSIKLYQDFTRKSHRLFITVNVSEFDIGNVKALINNLVIKDSGTETPDYGFIDGESKILSDLFDVYLTDMNITDNDLDTIESDMITLDMKKGHDVLRRKQELTESSVRFSDTEKSIIPSDSWSTFVRGAKFDNFVAAESVDVKLSKEEDKLYPKYKFSKFMFSTKKGPFSLNGVEQDGETVPDEEGDIVLEDKKGEYIIGIGNKTIPIPLSTGPVSISYKLGEHEQNMGLSCKEMEIAGITAKGIKLNVGKKSGAWTFGFHFDSFNGGERLPLEMSDVTASVSTRGIEIESVKAKIKAAKDIFPKGIEVEVGKLYITGEGISLETVKGSTGEIKIGDVATFKSAEISISKEETEDYHFIAGFTGLDFSTDVIPEIKLGTKGLSAKYDSKEGLSIDGSAKAVYGDDIFTLSAQKFAYSDGTFTAGTISGTADISTVLSVSAMKGKVEIAGENLRFGKEGYKRDSFSAKLFDAELCGLTLPKVEASFDEKNNLDMDIEATGNEKVGYGDYTIGLVKGSRAKIKYIDKKPDYSLEKLGLSVNSPHLSVKLDEITLEDSVLKIKTITGGIKNTGTKLDSVKVTGDNAEFSSKGIKFSSLGAKAEEEFKFLNDMLSIKNPEIKIDSSEDKLISNVSVGGELCVNIDNVSAGINVLLDFNESNNYKPELKNLSGISVSIDGLGSLKAENMKIQEDKSVLFEKLSLTGNFEQKLDNICEKDSLTHKVFSLFDGFSINLAKATYKAGKFDYDKKDISISKEEFSLEIGGFKGKVNTKEKTLSLNYCFGIPSGQKKEEADSDNNIPKQFDLNFSIPCAPLPLSIDFGAFAGAKLYTELGFLAKYDTDKDIKANAEAKLIGKAKVGLKAGVSFSAYELAKIGLNLEAAIIASVNSKLTGSAEVSVNPEKKSLTEKLALKEDSINLAYGLSGALKGVFKANVNMSLFKFFSKDLYSFEIGAFDIGSFSIGGKITQKDGKFKLNKDNSEFKTDINKDAFLPSNEKSALKFLKSYNNEREKIDMMLEHCDAFGLEDERSKTKNRQINTLSKGVLDGLNKTIEIGSNAVDKLKSSDSEIMKAIVGANVEIHKHEKRIESAQNTLKGVREATEFLLDNKDKLVQDAVVVNEEKLNALMKMDPLAILVALRLIYKSSASSIMSYENVTQAMNLSLNENRIRRGEAPDVQNSKELSGLRVKKLDKRYSRLTENAFKKGKSIFDSLKMGYKQGKSVREDIVNSETIIIEQGKIYNENHESSEMLEKQVAQIEGILSNPDLSKDEKGRVNVELESTKDSLKKAKKVKMNARAKYHKAKETYEKAMTKYNGEDENSYINKDKETISEVSERMGRYGLDLMDVQKVREQYISAQVIEKERKKAEKEKTISYTAKDINEAKRAFLNRVLLGIKPKKEKYSDEENERFEQIKKLKKEYSDKEKKRLEQTEQQKETEDIDLIINKDVIMRIYSRATLTDARQKNDSNMASFGEARKHSETRIKHYKDRIMFLEKTREELVSSLQWAGESYGKAMDMFIRLQNTRTEGLRLMPDNQKSMKEQIKQANGTFKEMEILTGEGGELSSANIVKRKKEVGEYGKDLSERIKNTIDELNKKEE